MPISFFLSIALLLTAPPASAPEELPESPRIFLATFGPGDEVEAWWGHVGVVVEELKPGREGQLQRHSRLYNYGTFLFDEKMLREFAMGRLAFWVEATPTLLTLALYAREDRDVRLWALPLTPAQARQLASALEENALPANRHYLYHHYADNCATRIRDIVDRAVFDGQFSTWLKAQPARMSIRAHTRRYSAVNPLMSFLLDFLQNDELDKPLSAYEETFLPDELEKRMLQFAAQHSTLSAPTAPWAFATAQKRPPTREEAPRPAWTCLALGLGVALAAAALGHMAVRKRWARWGLGLLSALWCMLWGLLGTALLAMEFTGHTVTHGNENLFLANPLWLLGCLWAWSYARKGTPQALGRLAGLSCCVAAIAWLGLGLKVFAVFDQNNWNVLGLLLPVHSALALVLVALARKGAKGGGGAAAASAATSAPSAPRKKRTR